MNRFLTETRITGLLYLGLAMTGVFVFAFAKSGLYVPGDAVATHTNLIEKESLARLGVAVELALVAFQAFVALWFYKLFSRVGNLAPVMIAVFGIINAIMILVSSAMWLNALDASIAGEPAATVFVLFGLHESIWLVSGLFFGLWLLPMGYAAAASNMPRLLATLLMTGGIGYILSTISLILLPDQGTLAGILIFPATIAEFWMVGYLLSKPQLNTR